MKNLLMFLLFLILGATIFFVVNDLKKYAKNTVVIQGNSEPTRGELKKAMKYHGILYAERDKNGEWYFIRDGQRCRLFAYKERGYK